MDCISKVREFVVESFLYGDDDGLTDSTLFLEEGLIDSTGFLELTMFLEKKFGITIEKNELVPDNLNSLNNINRFLEKKLGRVGCDNSSLSSPNNKID
jgi:acyl carrier protein